MKIIIDDEEYLTLDGLEDLTKIPKRTIYSFIRAGFFPQRRKLPFASIWRKKDIEEYIAKNKRS